MSNRTLLWLGGAPALLIVLGMVVKRLFPGAEAALTELGIGLLGLLVLGLTGLGHLVERLATPWGLVVLLGCRYIGLSRLRVGAVGERHDRPVLRAAEDRARRWGPSSAAREVKLEGNQVSVVSAAGALSYAYMCLPDTVDPRGPKGTK